MIAEIVKGLKTLVCLGAAGFAATVVADEAGTAKWSAMAARYKIDFPKVVVNEGVSIANFPMPVRLGSAWSENNGFSIANVATNQVRFFVEDEIGGGYEEVPFEVECWEKDRDRALVWVKIPNVVSGQALYMGVMATGSDEGLNPTEVWSEYYAVWHMNDTKVTSEEGNNASDGLVDSTRNSYNGTLVRSLGRNMNAVDTQLGKGVKSGTYNQRVAYCVDAANVKDLLGVKTFSIETIASTSNTDPDKYDKIISWRANGKYLIAQQLQNNRDGVRVDLAAWKAGSTTEYVNWQGFQTGKPNNEFPVQSLLPEIGSLFFTGFIATESGMMTNIVDTTILGTTFEGTNKAEDGKIGTGEWNGIGDGLTSLGSEDKFCIGGRTDSSANWMGVIDELRIATNVAHSLEFMALVRDSALNKENEWEQTINNADSVSSVLSLRQFGVSCAKIYYSLSGVANATKTLQLSTSDSFESIVDTRALAEYGSGPEYVITGLTPGMTYYARVKAESASLDEPLFSLPIEINLAPDQISLGAVGSIWRSDSPSFTAAVLGDVRLNYSAQLLVGDEVKATIETVDPVSGISFIGVDMGEATSATIKLTATSPLADEQFSVVRTAEMAITAGGLSGEVLPAALSNNYLFIGETVHLPALSEGMSYEFVNAYGVEIGNDNRSFTCRHASPLGIKIVNGDEVKKFGMFILPNKREGSEGDVWVRELTDGYGVGESSGSSYLSVDISSVNETTGEIKWGWDGYYKPAECGLKWKCVTNPSRNDIRAFPGMDLDKAGDIAVVFDGGVRKAAGLGYMNLNFKAQMRLDEFYYFNISPDSAISPKFYMASVKARTGLMFDTSDGAPGKFVYDEVWRESSWMAGSYHNENGFLPMQINAVSGLDIYFGRADLGDTQLGGFTTTAGLDMIVPSGKAITIRSGDGERSIVDGNDGYLALSGGGVFRNETKMKICIQPIRADGLQILDDSVIESAGNGVNGSNYRAGFSIKKRSRTVDGVKQFDTFEPQMVLASSGHAGALAPSRDNKFADDANAVGSIAVGNQTWGGGISATEPVATLGNRLDMVKKIVLNGGLLGIYGERVDPSKPWPEDYRKLTTTVNELELRPGFSVFNVGGDSDLITGTDQQLFTNDVHVAEVSHEDGAFLALYNARLMRKYDRDNGFLTFDGENAAMPWLFNYDRIYGLLPATVAEDGMVNPGNNGASITLTGGNVFKQGDAVSVSATGDCTVGADDVALDFTGHGYMTFAGRGTEYVLASGLASTVTVNQRVSAPAGLAFAAPCADGGKVVLSGSQRGIKGKGLTLAIGKFTLSNLTMRAPITAVGGATEVAFEGGFKSVSSLNLVSAGVTKPKVNPGADGVLVRELCIDGVQMPSGTYGSAESNADNKSDFFTGTGVVTVDNDMPVGGIILLVR